MHIKPPGASSAPENGPGTIDTTSDTATGKGCMGEGGGRSTTQGVCCLFWKKLNSIYNVFNVSVWINKPEHGDAF